MRPLPGTPSAVRWILLSLAGLTGCASSSGPVPLVITSHTPVKATATQLREGVAQLVKDWSDAKARIEEIHTRRVAEMMAIEADIAFLEEAAKIDPQAPTKAGFDAGRLERLLDLKAPKETFQQELERALEPPKPPQELNTYFSNDWVVAETTLTPEERQRMIPLWRRLSDLTRVEVRTGPELARWLASNNFSTWSDVLVRFAGRDAQGRPVDGVMVLEAVRAAAQNLRLPPPDISQLQVVGARAVARLRHRREQFPAVDQLLSNLLTISRDLDTYLQNDVDAIHWKELGEAIGKGQTLSNDVLGGSK
jgi:hypothetical protein